MDKQATLHQITELLAEQESAIQRLPPATSAVYMKGRTAFTEGQKSAKEVDWMRLSGITVDELSLVHRVMLSSSFMSGWCHLSADKKMRDGLAHSCCLVVTTFLGLDPKQVMQEYLNYESYWRRRVEAEGVAPGRFSALFRLMIFAAGCVVYCALIGESDFAWGFLIVCLFVSITTGFTIFSRGEVFLSATGRILQSALCLSCFGLMILAFFRYGWKIGMGVIFLIFVGGKIGLSLLKLASRIRSRDERWGRT